jgi:hypothetical protein
VLGSPVEVVIPHMKVSAGIGREVRIPRPFSFASKTSSDAHHCLRWMRWFMQRSLLQKPAWEEGSRGAHS